MPTGEASAFTPLAKFLEAKKRLEQEDHELRTATEKPVSDTASACTAVVLDLNSSVHPTASARPDVESSALGDATARPLIHPSEDSKAKDTDDNGDNDSIKKDYLDADALKKVSENPKNYQQLRRASRPGRRAGTGSFTNSPARPAKFDKGPTIVGRGFRSLYRPSSSATELKRSQTIKYSKVG